MRRLRTSRLLAAALGLALGTANPASVLAHAEAHHRDAHEAHGHVTSLGAHDGPAELSTPDRAGTHQHARLDRAMRSIPHQLAPGPAMLAAAPALDLLAIERVCGFPAPSVTPPDPPGNDPPRVRAPPLS